MTPKKQILEILKELKLNLDAFEIYLSDNGKNNKTMVYKSFCNLKKYIERVSIKEIKDILKNVEEVKK